MWQQHALQLALIISPEVDLTALLRRYSICKMFHVALQNEYWFWKSEYQQLTSRNLKSAQNQL